MHKDPFYKSLGYAISGIIQCIQKERNIVPIEVKAEGNLRSQSLKAYCEKFHPNMAVRLSALKYKEQDWMINLALYAVCNL